MRIAKRSRPSRGEEGVSLGLREPRRHRGGEREPRGSWHKLPPRATVRAVIAVLSVLAGGGAARAQAADPPIEVHTLESRVYGNSRSVRVLLPPGYHDPRNRDRRYPVLYLNDGQDLFSAETSLFGSQEWGIDELYSSADASAEFPIIVGIDTGRRTRANEYLPWPDESLQPPVTDPQGSRYPEFVLTEVIPLIDARYRTVATSAGRGIGGASYGALIALYTVGRNPGWFSTLLLESPSLYVHDAAILRASEQVDRWPCRIAIGVGTNEAGREDWNQEAVDDVMRLAGILERAGLTGERLRVVVEEGAVHSPRSWGDRFAPALRFLYPIEPGLSGSGRRSGAAPSFRSGSSSSTGTSSGGGA